MIVPHDFHLLIRQNDGGGGGLVGGSLTGRYPAIALSDELVQGTAATF